MPANTPGYSLPYLLGTDANNTIDSGFKNLAEAVEATLNSTGAKPLVTTTSNYSNTTYTKSSTAWSTIGTSVAVTVGASGIVIVHQWALFFASATTVACQVSINTSGAKTIGSGTLNEMLITRNVDRHTGSVTYVITGCTPGATLTVNGVYAGTAATSITVLENKLTAYTLG